MSERVSESGEEGMRRGCWIKGKSCSISVSMYHMQRVVFTYLEYDGGGGEFSHLSSPPIHSISRLTIVFFLLSSNSGKCDVDSRRVFQTLARRSRMSLCS